MQVNTTTQTHELEVDFVVAGGGMSGVCAAIAAARNGARTVLIQERSVLGGNASSEIRMHICGADSHGRKPGVREGGIMEELRLEDAVRNPQRSFSQWDLLLYEKVIEEPNITLLLDTVLTGATMQGDTLTAITAERQSTEDCFHIKARFFADCTGDGRLGLEAGADWTRGREARADYGESLARDNADKQTLGSSIMLMARKYETPQPFIAPKWIRHFDKEDFKFRPIRSYEYGYWWLEWGGQFDTIKDNEKIRHELLRIALGAWNYIKNSGDHPESSHWALDWVSAIPGKRESRRFLGPHVLTQTDVLDARVFADAVAYGGWAIDLHPPSGVDLSNQPPFTPTDFSHIYTIPFGCYHSRNIANLLFAGRNISATHVAFASTRVMATCAIGGQAIGTAAALWRSEPGNDLRTLAAAPARISALQQTLLRDDCWLPTVHSNDPLDLAQSAHISASSEVDGHPARCVIDGHLRDLKAAFGPWSVDSCHAWHSQGLPATLELTLPTPQPLSEVHLTFDSGFQRELTLSASDHSSARVIRAAQPETVKQWRLLFDGVPVHTEDFNYLRKCVIRIGDRYHAPVSKVTIEITQTHGAPQTRVFEVRLYGKA